VERPQCIRLDEARQVLAEIDVHLNARQMKRAAEPATACSVGKPACSYVD
jgi:hypothetical protein